MTSRARSLIHQYRNKGTRPAVLADVSATIAGRDLDLVDALLTRLERLEAATADPDMLAELYGLDHLAARLRRNAENLRVLSGHVVGTTSDETAPLLDVLRAALSSIEDYPRVSIGRVVALGVVASAADDVGRLLAELLDDATVRSADTVLVSAHLTERGSVLVRLEDPGSGLPDGELATVNTWLAAEPVLDGDSVARLGLAVVRVLAARHGIQVRLDRRTPGTTVSVLLPPDLLREAPPLSFARTPSESVPATTASGLPKRRPRRHAKPEPAGDSAFMADLAAFAEGEQEAVTEREGVGGDT
jgi:signal transduction histidine kinase